MRKRTDGALAQPAGPRYTRDVKKEAEDKPRLGEYIRVTDVLRRLPVSAPTLAAWAADPAHPCPPIYSLGSKTRVMDAAAVEAWIRSSGAAAGDDDGA